MADLGSTSALDPVDICLLLVTTATTSTGEMVAAMAEVFGESGSIEVSLCRDLFLSLAKYDTRWDQDFFTKLDSHLDSMERVAHNALMEMPCIKERVA
jgi:hypothetical protein